MRLSGTCRLALAAVVAVPLGGCGQGTEPGGGGGAGGGTPPTVVDPADLVSDFENDMAAVLPLGSPVRNGYWYSYNDASATCLQSPMHGEPYYPSTPPVLAPSGGRALHAAWSQCATWGAGVGADFSVAAVSGGLPSGARNPYNVEPFAGVAFWAMAAPGTSTSVRAKIVMRVSTQVQDGGTCDESVLGPDRCGDEWGEPFTLRADGSWTAVTVRFSDPAFKQEGWGQPFAWNPADVLGIQLQSIAATGLYDFWIDGVYLIR
jgi:hypothetical protein